MPRGRLSCLPVIVAVAIVVTALQQPALATAAGLKLSTVPSPARGASHEPNLCALPDGRVAMSWLEDRKAGGLSLRYSAFDGQRWTPPSTIAEGDSFFANWADFPSVRAVAGGGLVAHWLWESGAGEYSYDVRLSRSEDGGKSWSPPVIPHRDGTATEHGFVSLVPAAEGVMALWLDGRNGASHSDTTSTPDMTLRAAVVGRDGRVEQETLVDGRTCDCCQTAAVRTNRGVLVAYRDRSANEVRDIFTSLYEGGRWTEPSRLYADDWEINGCPVNGPALDARGDRVAVAWYSGATTEGAVRVAFSSDGGRTFGAPIRIDDGHPLGRVHITMESDDIAFLVWMESDGQKARIRGRSVAAHGPLGPGQTLAETSAARASGFPRVVRTSRMRPTG